MKMKLSLIIVVVFCSTVVFGQSPVASFPFEQYGDHSFIKVKVNDSRELDFIFDTGDGLTVLNVERAKEFDMLRGSDVNVISAEGTISGKMAKHNKISIAGTPVHNVKIYETSLNHLEMSVGKDIDGIIGYDILKNYVVSMNFDKMMIELYDNGSYSYSGKGKEIAIRLTSYIPHITGAVNLYNGETLTGEFFVDTGAGTTLDFNTPFVEKNGMTSKIGNSYVYLVAGLGEKEYEHHRGKVKSFSFKGFSFDDMPVGLSYAEKGIQNHKKVAGILGSGVLKKFNIIYNYKAKKMYWEKNENYGKPFMQNTSGIELQLSKGKSQVLVHKVFENSPASESGIKVDAVIESVNGEKATERGLAEIKEIFSQDGKIVNLVIDGKSFDLQLRVLL